MDFIIKLSFLYICILTLFGCDMLDLKKDENCSYSLSGEEDYSTLSFSKDRGLYYKNFDLKIESDIKGNIYFTTDGTLPTPENGTRYEGAIEVTTTSVFKASLYASSKQTGNTLACPVRLSKMESHTYIFPEHVLEQQPDIAPEHETWGHAGPDWAMDETVIQSDAMPNTQTDILTSHASISLAMDWKNWFGINGIYLEGENREHVTSVEYIHPNKEGFQVHSAVEIFGGTSSNRWKVDKLSMKLTFRKESGYGKLDYKLFEDTHVDQFDRIILDATHNLSLFHPDEPQRERFQVVRDQFVADLQNEIGGYAPHGNYAHLYLNGIYWGLYYIHERPDQSFAEEYTGGDEDEYDVIKHHPNTIVHGSNKSFKELMGLVEEDLTIDKNYEAVEKLLDIEDYIKYILVNLYVGNGDWPMHNWYATHKANGKWRFHSWDAEHSLKSRTSNRINGLHKSNIGFNKHLLNNSSYRKLFDKIVAKEFHGTGVFSPTRAAELYTQRLSEVEVAVFAESARWGDNMRPDNPHTKEDDWETEKAWLLDTYFPERSDNVLEDIEEMLEGYFTEEETDDEISSSSEEESSASDEEAEGEVSSSDE